MELNDKQQKRLGKMASIERNPSLAIIDELSPIKAKLEAIKVLLGDLNGKDVKTYEEELKNLSDEIVKLQDCLMNKEMVVNVESNVLALENINKVLTSILEENKKEQSINVELVIE